MDTYRYVDLDGDHLEVRPWEQGGIKLDSFDGATEHRVILAVPAGRIEELIAGIRAAAEAGSTA
jgi:hypothetical protein